MNLTGTTPTTGTWAAQAGNPAGATLGATTAGVANVCFSAAATGSYNFIYTVSGGCSDTTTITVNPQATVGNYVWNDLNNNGLQDEVASAGINGVTVELWNATTNTLVATTTTANNGGNPGYYEFKTCTAGNYYIKFPTTNGGNGLTTQTPTAATDGNSDASTTTGQSPVFTLDPAGTAIQKNNPTIDAGYGCASPATPTCAPVTICTGVDATAMVTAAVSPAGGTITWNTGSATTATSYTYTVTNSCGSSSCTNTITRTSVPATPTCSPVTICTGVDATAMVTAAVSPAGGTITWNTGSATTATSYTYTVTNSCGSSSCTNTITRTSVPATPTCSPVTICTGVDATAMVTAAVSPAGGTITWNTGSATTATSYTYTVTNSCGSSSCSNNITRTPTPSSVTCNPVTVCIGADATSTVMSSVSISGGTITWNTGSATTATSYTYTITNSCGSASCTNVINRVSLPATPTCAPITICEGL
ncbi:MAG: SdrD B-like domain-containing protein, partial [Dolichospermum sp.]